MKKSKLTRTLMAACSVVALSAVMYGCVHSGDGDDTPPPVVEPDPDPVDVDTKKINDAIGAATAAIDGLTDMSTDADVTAAQNAVADAQAALDATTVLSLADVRAFQNKINAASTSLDAKKSAIADYRTHKSQLDTATTAVDGATSAVAGLDEDSTDAEADAAEDAIDAAATAVMAGTMLTASEKATLNGAIALARANLGIVRAKIADRKDEDRQDEQRSAVEQAIGAATTAVNGLSNTSSDADITAAQATINAAKTALDAATALSATDAFKFQSQINTAQTSLDSKKMVIADHRKHQGQLNLAQSAVDTAKTAVGALTVDSTDAAVTDAENKIAAARKALSDGDMLTAEERSALAGELSTAETSLGTVKTAIDNRKTHDKQLTAANNAVDAAKMAVDALDKMSSDDDITAAQGKIEAAEGAVTAGTMLTDEETSAANTKITAAKTGLEKVTVEAKIYSAETAVNSLTDTSTDEQVGAAEAAISAAKAALNKVKLLTASQVIAFQGEIDAARSSLDNKRTQIADSKDHQQQLGEVNNAIDAAKMAVEALDQMSDDAAIEAAQAKIDAAEAAVTAGTKLTADERSEANTKINGHKTALEKVTVEAKVYAAKTAVGNLTATSTDKQVEEAQDAIDDATAALNKAGMLSASQALGLRDDIDDAQDDLEDAKTLIADTAEHGKQLKAVNDAVDAAKMAVAALSAASTDADADAASEKIKAAEEAVKNGTMLTEDEKKAANTDISAAKTTLTSRKSDIKDRRDDRKRLATAIGNPVASELQAELTIVNGTATSNVRGGEVTATNYEESKTDAAPAIPRWTGSVYEKVTKNDDDEVTETDTVVVYTDKQASKPTNYTTYYASNASAAPDTDSDSLSTGFSWQAWVGVDSVSDDTNGILNLIEGTAIPVADVTRLFEDENFGSGQNKLPQKGDSRTYEDEDEDTAGIQVEFPGTFHGVAGTFKCSTGSNNDGTCTAARGTAGALTLAGTEGTWTFVPTSTKVKVAGTQVDADFLDFGYWVNEDVAVDPDDYDVGAFFRGQSPNTDISAVTGSATYKGAAAGLYAKQVYDGNTLLDDQAGRFTADATLTAYFGQITGSGNDANSIAPNVLNSISGTIDNFMDASDQSIDSGWSVKLNKIGGTGGTGSFNTSGGTFTGGTTAGGGTSGSWNGQFYGTDADDGGKPTAVGGQFTAGFHNGDVVGAFGAAKTKTE